MWGSLSLPSLYYYAHWTPIIAWPTFDPGRDKYVSEHLLEMGAKASADLGWYKWFRAENNLWTLLSQEIFAKGEWTQANSMISSSSCLCINIACISYVLHPGLWATIECLRNCWGSLTISASTVRWAPEEWGMVPHRPERRQNLKLEAFVCGHRTSLLVGNCIVSCEQTNANQRSHTITSFYQI